MKFTKEMIEKSIASRKAKKELKQVVVNGKTIELDKQPKYQREYWIRLSEIENSAVKAIKLKCYECSAYSVSEANQCKCKDCALWVYLHRSENNS